MKRLSIRWQLTIWYGAVLSALIVVFSVAVFLLMQHHLLALTDAALAEESADFASDVGRCQAPADFPKELGLRYASHEGYEFQVCNAEGVILFRSDELGRETLPIPELPSSSARPVYASLALNRLGRWRMASRGVSGSTGPLIVQAAVSLKPNDEAVRELVAVLILAGPLTLSGAVVGGYWLARQALAPVDRMVATAQEITATRLDRRLDVPNPRDELGRLASTFNDMFARLQRSFEEVRRFTADAAHELRTPLAVMRTEAEVVLRAPRDPERDGHALEDLLEEIDRLTRLVTQLLFLCREDSGVGVGKFQPVHLEEMVREVGDHMQVVANEKGVLLRVDSRGLGQVHGDADRLRQLLFNLLDNAIKYTPTGGTVTIWGDSSDGRASVEVADTGIGISDEHLPRVFDRFFRVDPARGRDLEGTGLGLAICRSIAEAHNGQIRIESRLGQGTRMTLTLPTCAKTGHEPQSDRPGL